MAVRSIATPVKHRLGPSVPAILHDYVGRGWPIFPLHARQDNGVCDCGNPRCLAPAKHPRTAHGFKDATVRSEIIRQWSSRWPLCNWGIATGSASGLLILDVDSEAGKASVKGFPAPYSVKLQAILTP